MHIVIMGCGRVGSLLARELSSRGHSIAIIDRDPEAFRRLGPDFRGIQISGLGFDKETLVKARINEAHAFAAVSSGDNSNIIAARVAREQFGVDTVVARIYDEKRAAVYERLGIPTVATVPWTTDRLVRAIVPDDQQGEWTDPTGHMTIATLPYHDDWIGRLLTELERSLSVRTCFVHRWGKTVLPYDDLVIQEGDIVYAAVPAASLQNVIDQSSLHPNEVE